MQETWVQSLGREDPLEKEMAAYSSMLAWEVILTEESGSLQSMGLQRVGQGWAIEHTHMLTPWGRCLMHSEMKTADHTDYVEWEPIFVKNYTYFKKTKYLNV